MARYDWPRPASFYQKLREVGVPSVLATSDKVYFVPTSGEARMRNIGES